MNLNEEVRSDYLVTAEAKKLWAVQMEILEKIDQICKKYGLKYYADGGTLLGAVRHKGYIPWDDDLDVQMLKEDYEKFCEVAPKELNEPYFFQSYKTEKGFFPWLVRVRRSDTTCISEWELENNWGGHKGIFVDIFPLYNVPDSKLKYKWQSMRLKYLKFLFQCYETDRALTEYNGKPSFKRNLAKFYWRVTKLFTNPEKICDKYLKIAAKEGSNTKKIGYLTFLPGNPKYLWDRSLYAESVDLPFEDRTIPAPYKYEEVLTLTFGDWHTPVKFASVHTTLTYSTDVPYTEYIKKLGK